MPTLREIFRFEVAYQIRRPVFAICTLLFALLALGAVSSDHVTIGGAIGGVNRNAPYVVMQILLVLSALGMFVSTAFVADSVNRDFEYATDGLYFSLPLSRRDFLLGRFSGAMVVAFLVYLGVALGIVVGSHVPWVDHARIGPTQLAPYVYALFVLVLPNLYLSAALFFALAALTRSLLWTYVGVVGFLVAYLVTGSYLADLENQAVVAIFDPLGIAAFEVATKYWTVAEKNSAVLAFDPSFVVNRLLCLVVGSLLLAFTVARFRPQGGRAGRGTRRVENEAQPTAPPALARVASKVRFDRWTSLRQFAGQARIEVLATLKSAPFLVILGFGVLNLIASSGTLELTYGTPVYPVTHLMLGQIASSYEFLVVIVLTFYAGEMCFRERSLKLDGVYDALPARSWVYWGAKLTALIAVIGAMLGVAMLTGMGIQLWQHYTRFEPLLYLQGLFLIDGARFVEVAVLALALQALVNSKYLGMLAMVVFFVSAAILNALKFEHNLWRYAATPAAPYSDMNGFGPFVLPLLSYHVVWAGAALVLVAATQLLWVRGAETSLRHRLALARERTTRPVRAAVALGALVAVAGASWVYYNTNVRNRYMTSDAALDLQADYEKTYQRHTDLPQPRIVAVKADVDIFPERREVAIKGSYVLRNKTDRPIDAVHISISPRLARYELSLAASRVELEDRRLGYTILRLDRPMAPGEERELDFVIAIANPGFKDHDEATSVVANGTFFNSFETFPHLGYLHDGELQDPNQRRKRGLEPVQRMPRIDDEKARRNNYLSADADWLSFDTTVSTSADQLAIAPGYVERAWTANGRNYVHYKMDRPILAFWAYLSARYAVQRDAWHDVAIEVDYHPDHAWNVPRMIDGVKQSLDYFTRNFSPYQHRQVRIVEFPRYASFAQSFPNTIPYSESIGFIARIEKPEDIDYVFYVTAHEVAHQWWAHQVIGANVQGATVLSETLAQYSALMVMEHAYGPAHMRKFLKYELDRYLKGRGQEKLEELPLALNENQSYIHYAKGSLALYALKDAVGEEAVNRALASFLKDKAYQEPPYTTSRELLGYLRAVVPGDKLGLLDDLFENITLYENRARAATWERQADGKYLVRLQVDLAKFHADGPGRETAVGLDDWIDVGVYGKKSADTPPEGKLLLLEKRHLVAGAREIEMVVDEEPVKAGIDPLNKLVDRSPENNLVKVTAAR